MWVGSLGWEDPLEKEMATLSSILAWKNPMDTGACRATVQRVGHDSSELAHTHAIEGYLVYFLVLAITDKAAINSMCRFL